ncbi:hypothetical protein SpCBS45565_g03060 [Spizellomyces sp. 'palustris']|nr:hypothetical protein SpCBS45565_g03060 [Spizellomyces sp. 'palustris']
MANGFQQPKLLWKPSRPEETQMTKFKSFVERIYHIKLANYDALWKWSVENYPEFWASVWEYCGVKASVPYTEVVERDVSMDKIPKWFKGARLNFAENLLARRDDHIALIGAGEHGVRPGDRIAGYLPNCPDTVIVFLAVTSLGAIWSSTSPDFGITGVLERFSQVKPKILFSVNAVMYNGRAHDHLGKLKEVAEGLESLEKVVIIPFVEVPFDATMIPMGETYKDFLIADDGRDIIFEQLPFYHPLVILYSSGTTGKPKCIVHSAGGILIQHLKEHVIHGDLSESDVFFYYTTTGWMMWNWLVSGLAAGATLVLYDGSPFKPTPARLLDLVDELKITVFGTSAKYIQSLQEATVTPIKSHNLSTLRTIYSTGSPLKPESFDYVYTQVKEDVLLGSITGGTDIVSLFAGHNAALPVYRGEIQCRGKPVYDEPGDLICTKPFPVMPVYFWNDPENEKYRAAYFSRFEGETLTVAGYRLQLHSKYKRRLPPSSDGTLNPAGVRFGSAELYNILDQFPQLADTLVVGQKRGADERVILFCKMADGHQFTPEIVESIKSTIKGLLSARHVPAVILPIADIPYTVNGKKVEVAVKRIISGETLIPSGTLANPESLKLYYNLPELK